MFLHIIIFICYFIVCCLAISTTKFYKNSGLKRWQLLLLFAIKVLAGIAYGLFYKLPRYYETADTWRFFRLSLNESDWLKHDPIAFTKDLFIYGYQNSGGLFSGSNSYWNDLKSNVVVKALAVCNVLTNNNYYADVILFNFIFFIGFVALFKVVAHIFPNKKGLIIFGIFLMPSTLFWCSGIHKDGLILSATGIIILIVFHFFNYKVVNVAKFIVFLFCLLLVFALRNYVMLALMSALFCWWLATKFRGKEKIIFPLVYLVGIVLFFAVPYLIPSLNFPYLLANKQHEFLALSGGSEVQVEALTPSFTGYIQYFPDAFTMAFLQPIPSQAHGIAGILAMVELAAAYLLLALCIIFGKWPARWQAFFWFNVCFGISILLIAGYTITFAGAIVRYRSFAFPFLITTMLCSLPVDKRNNWSSFFALKTKRNVITP